jgi:hypothetical protein
MALAIFSLRDFCCGFGRFIGDTVRCDRRSTGTTRVPNGGVIPSHSFEFLRAIGTQTEVMPVRERGTVMEKGMHRREC